MPTHKYQQLSYALCAENGRWTMKGLRFMIGNEAAYKRYRIA